MVAAADFEPAFKVWSSLAVVDRGLIRVWAIARTAEDALPRLLERSARFKGGGELFDAPAVYCKATKAAMADCGLNVDTQWTAEEILAVASNELRYFSTSRAVYNVKLDRVGSYFIRLHRQLLNARK